jgi:periplasmic protein TonB
MNKLILVTLIMACSFSALAQDEKQSSSDSTNAYQPVVGTYSRPAQEVVFTSIDEMPQFPGGMPALMDYLGKNIQYPSKAKKNDIEGRVIVKFVVCENGTLCNEEIVKSIGGGCDEEVIRVVKAMPNWKPGKQNGKAVRVYYTLPVTFRFKEENKSRKTEK